ncbi:sacsin N-terminal ATP-binding-like domain-containing protein, partial [Streptomyces sp. NP160]|uniref:sacsin N-terminal ATP-binding-like domain-containing protein n=1 Tax=Streptomyces sp. NP160 TaxID=2586637 RepID=UPI0035A6E188
MSTPSELPADPFGAAALRRAALDAWAASPDRFREDANAEEDAALGAYRDRAVVELAQNAADAAARSGAPGRLVLRLEGARLLALNTGAPLDADGVRALSSLRASAKRASPALTGRFGVGAASVLAVSDDATWCTRTGGVRFSADLTRAAVAAGAPAELDAALAARGGAVPVLRLPFAVDVDDDVRELLDAEGCDTAVVVVLR